MRSFLFIFGLFMLVDGLLLLVSSEYLEWWRRKFWNRTSVARVFSEKDTYLYDRYGRGIEGVVVGAVAILAALFIL